MGRSLEESRYRFQGLSPSRVTQDTLSTSRRLQHIENIICTQLISTQGFDKGWRSHSLVWYEPTRQDESFTKFDFYVAVDGSMYTPMCACPKSVERGLYPHSENFRRLAWGFMVVRRWGWSLDYDKCSVLGLNFLPTSKEEILRLSYKLVQWWGKRK